MKKKTVIVAAALWLGMACGIGARAQGREVLLDGLGADMAVDAARQRLYVSVPSSEQVVVISTETYEIIERITFDTEPRRIDISIDGSLLFVALDAFSTVAFVDLETFTFSQVVISTELDSPRTWDVIEGRPGRVFVSANPRGGFSNIVMIDRDANNAAIRVARALVDRPIFARSPDGTALYVGSRQSPYALYKLDISENPGSGTTGAPVILQDRYGYVSRTHALALSPDGDIIYTSSGQALRTDSFNQVGIVGAGVPRVSDDGSLVYVAQAPDTISVYETTTYALVGSVTTPCSMDSIHAFDILPNGTEYVIQADDIVCAGRLDVIDRPADGIFAKDSLGGLGADMEVDAARQRLYVSVPSRNQVVVISTETYEIIERVTVGTGPRGIDISVDGSLLFVALDGGGSVVFLDLETLNFSTLEIGTELGSPRAWDVIEGRHGRVFVSASGSVLRTFITMIDRDANNAAIRVTSNRFNLDRPIFASSPDGAALYVGGYERLYKMDISENPGSGTTAAPIILEGKIDSPFLNGELVLSPDGNIIYTAGGQALRTDSFNQVGIVGGGVPRASDDGSLVYVAQAPDTISVYATATYTLVGSITTPCSMDSIHAFDILPNGTEYVIQADDFVCTGTLDAFEPPAEDVITKDSLGGLAADMEVDTARQRLYVSVPSRNQVVIISTETYEIIERVTVGPQPRGIDISIDGSLLFVALDGAGSVVFLDLETFDFSKVEISAELGDPRTWDVIEGRPGRVFAVAGGAGSSYVVMIDRDANNTAIRVAAGARISGRSPKFAGSPDGTVLYVGAGYTWNSLLKLDISENPGSGTTAAPIVLQGGVYGTYQLALSPDGNIIYTVAGQALNTGSFNQVGLVGVGVPRISDDGSLVYVAQAPDTISVYETATYTLVASMTTPCSMESIHAFDILSNGEDYVILADDFVCTGTLDQIELPADDIFPKDTLGGLGADMEVDAARQRLYVSVPSLNQVVVISTETYEIIERVRVGTGPRGIDMSDDQRLLFVALDGGGSVVFLDLETLDYSKVEIGTELGSPRTWDVIEGRHGRVFASADEFRGFSYIAMIDRDANNAAVRVDGNMFAQGRPKFAGSPNLADIYIGGYNSLYKLDISDNPFSVPTLVGPFLLQDFYGSLSELALSPDGNIIYTASGHALSTGSLNQVGKVGAGVPRVSDDGSLVYVAKAPDTISVYETTTYTLIGSMTTPCSMDSIHAFDILPKGAEYVIQADDSILEDYVIQADDFVCTGTLSLRRPGTESFSIPDRGGQSITSNGTEAETREGYGRIGADAGSTTPSGIAIIGYSPGGTLISEAGVPATEAVRQGRIFAEVNGPVNTGLAIANPNDAPATIDFYFTDADGARFAEGAYVLDAGRQIADFLNETPFNGGDEVLGTFTFTSSLPIAVIALRGFTNRDGEFLMTTLPVAPLATPLTPFTTDTAYRGTVYFPHFADGSGWATQVILVNPTVRAITGTVRFLGQGSATTAAAPAVRTLEDGRTGSSFDYSIPPNGSYRIVTSNPPGGVAVGSVRAIPDLGHRAPSGLVIFSFTSAGKTVLEAGVPALAAGSAFRVYVESSGMPEQIGSIRTGLAITNAADTANTVTLEVTGLDGTLAAPPAPLMLPPSGQVSRFIDEFFDSLPPHFSGVLRVTSTAEVAIVGLRLRYNDRGELKMTTTPPSIETGPSTMADRYFPHIVDSAGWSTQFILFSGTAGQASSGTLSFIDTAGEPWDLPRRGGP